MPRKGQVPRREAAPDPKFDSLIVSRFLSSLMKAGKRSTAEGAFYRAMDIVGEKTGQDPMAVLKQAVNNVKPILELRDGVVEPVGRVRGRQKALEEFARLFTDDTEDRAGLRTAIAHANAPEWIEVLTDLVSKTRPQATVDLVQLLGAVVGTHAGPGAVGFFWFQD